MELIAEFVFCDVDRKGAKKRVSLCHIIPIMNIHFLIPSIKQRLTRIQEMQLLEVLSDYFAFSHGPNLGGDAARNTVFMSLFPHTFVDRCQLLVKLVSIAICTNNIPLLSATGSCNSRILRCFCPSYANLFSFCENTFQVFLCNKLDVRQNLVLPWQKAS